MAGVIDSALARRFLQDAIQKEIASGKKQIDIPSGTYYFSPNEKGIHLTIENLTDTLINAVGVNIICTKTTCAIWINRCTNLTIKGLTVDYDPLPFTQGKIQSIREDKIEYITSEGEKKSEGCTSHCIEIDKGYPTFSQEDIANIKEKEAKGEGLHYEIFDHDKRTRLICENGKNTPLQNQGDYYGCHLDVEPDTGATGTKSTPQSVDNPIVQKIRIKTRYIFQYNVENNIGVIPYSNLTKQESNSYHFPHAICIFDSTEVKLSGVTLNASPCFGFFEFHCTNNEYNRCKSDRLDLKNDRKTLVRPRMRSLNGDGFHSISSTIGPKYLNCTAKYLGDDCVAIHGIFHIVIGEGKKENQWRIMARNDWEMKPDRSINSEEKMNIEDGDVVHIMSKEEQCVTTEAIVLKVETIDVGNEIEQAFSDELQSPPPATAATASNKTKLTEEERVFIKSLKTNTKLQKGIRSAFAENKKVYLMTLNTGLPLEPGSLICSANKIGNRFVVENGDFGFTRARGILIKARSGKIHNNEINKCARGAIVLQPEYSWLEGGFPELDQAKYKSIKLVDNKIEGKPYQLPPGPKQPQGS
ncbi:MAG: hypothetical protein JSS10_05385 [Verrucomicrobia bacterium]|nr:hypothetical protein [Verrucomicrobiota bacterium]